MNVNNVDDFLKARKCSEKTFEEVKRNTYKYTDCGAWIEKDDDSIIVGSIVEGVDWDCQAISLKYPFKVDDFWKALKSVEDEANEIWNDTHGCDDCGIEHPEYGTRMINPKCTTCEGDGAII